MIRLNEFLEIFDMVIDVKKEQKLVCGSGMATALFDHKRFKYCDNGLKHFWSPNYSGGNPYVVGYIGRCTVMIEPGIGYNEMSIYDGKYRRIYNFGSNNFKLEEII